MAGTNTEHFSQEILDLFDRYVHGLIDRRGFLEQAATLSVGTSPEAILDALNPRFAEARKVAPDDVRLRAEFVTYESPEGTGRVRAYLVRPAALKGRLPAVLVVHENRGLNPHIEDVARRLALDGFLTLAPDALTPVGGYPGDEDKARAAFARLDQARALEDFVAAVGFLRDHAEASGQVGVVGFCYGGRIANVLATRIAYLGAAAPFYGTQAQADQVARIHAPLLIHYAEHDERVNAGIAAFEQALKASKVDYLLHIYPGTQHGFHNDTTPRYEAAAASLAWGRTVAFLRSHLGA